MGTVYVLIDLATAIFVVGWAAWCDVFNGNYCLGSIIGCCNDHWANYHGADAGSDRFGSFGLVGFPVHPLSVWRVVGVILLVAGVVFVQRT